MALKRYWLVINGARRMAVCDPEKDTLAVVLRRMGLTGTKIGCDAGQCGACSVILDGEVVRSCIKRMKNIKDDAVITTIEGIGTPDNLHPLQVAWNTYGAVQCGFCSPGFIVSAKGLLDVNPDPTREEVRAWFAKHKNVCRCTGYKPIVDAVMAAAKVMRGEATMEDITWKMPEDGVLYGTKFPRRETGIARVTGLCNYGDDVRMAMPDDTLELAPVFPDVAHANIISIDTTEAEKMPGVVKVITAKDVKGTNRIAIGLGHPRALAVGDEREILCSTKICKYGDVVALVAADTREHAREAAKKVVVNFEELPAYNQLEAMMPDAVEIHPGIPNIMLKHPLKKGDTKEAIAKAAHVVEGSFYSTREPHLPIEPDVGQAYIDADGDLVLQYKSQFVYAPSMFIAAGIGWPADKVKCVANEVGGSFGYSVSSNTMALTAVATIALDGRAVNMTLSYPEQQHLTGKRAPTNTNIRLACDENGKMQALEYHISYDQGGYTEFIQSLTCKAHFFMGFGYNIPNALGISQGCYSNYGFHTTYRAFSSTQVMTASEAIVDEMAYELGMDPFDFRYLNAVREGDKNLNGSEYPEYYIVEMMDMLKPEYEDAKAFCEKMNAETPDNIKYGVGLTMGGYAVGDPIDTADADVELMPNGDIVLYSTWEDVGQHGEPAALMHMYEALRPMNVPLEKIKLVSNDQKAGCPNTGIAGGSRLHVSGGGAAIDGCNKLMDAMRKADGTYRTYDEMVAEGIPTKVNGHFSNMDTGARELDPNNGQGCMFKRVMYNLFMAVVHCDVNTGKVTVDRMRCVADSGKIGNVLGVEGQCFGGLEHGIGFALQEDYSDMKKHATMVGAGTLTIDQMPDDIELIVHDSYRKYGTRGSVGASENFQSSGHVAVLNALRAATGVRIYELPARPEKVKAAYDALQKGEVIKPEKYWLGADLYDAIDDCEANPVPEDVARRYMRVDE